MFLKIVPICKNKIFDTVCGQNSSRDFLKLPNLFVITSSTCSKGLVCLLKFLWYFEKDHKQLKYLQFSQCCYLFLLQYSTKCQNQTKISKNISVYLFVPFIKSALLYPGSITIYCYSKKYQYTMKTVLTIVWSTFPSMMLSPRTAIWCDTPWRRAQHNLTLHFKHLNPVFVLHRTHTIPHSFPFSLPVFIILLFQPVWMAGLPHGVIWGWDTFLPSSIRSLSKASLKFMWDNLEP